MLFCFIGTSTLEKKILLDIVNIIFLLFQELLRCSEKLFGLLVYSANCNTLHLHFTPFLFASVHLYLDAKN